MRRRIPFGPRRVARVAAVAVLGAVLAACGPPDYRFHASATNELVLKMPRSWSLVRSGVPVGQDGQQADAGNWVAMFDAAARPSTEHVQSGHATAPTAVMASIAVTKEVGAALTDDELRDYVFPVTSSARTLAQLSGFTGTDFRLVTDEGVRTRTAQGVHVVFSYDNGQGPEVYEQISVTDSRKTRVHVLLVHCDRTCYDRHRAVIAETVRSFTVKIL